LCQQHDERMLAGASARTFELDSCCPQETTEIVRFLMRIEKPDNRIGIVAALIGQRTNPIGLASPQVTRTHTPGCRRHRCSSGVHDNLKARKCRDWNNSQSCGRRSDPKAEIMLDGINKARISIKRVLIKSRSEP
jgi:Pectic acid lyase